MKKDKIIIGYKKAHIIQEKIQQELEGVEIPKGYNVAVKLQPKKRIPIPDYTMVFQCVGMLVIKEIKPATLVIFWTFLCKLSYSNHIGMNQETIAEETNLSPASISRGIKELINKKMIIAYSDEVDKRRNVYIVNPQVAWRGENLNRIKALKKISEDDRTQLQLWGGK